MSNIPDNPLPQNNGRMSSRWQRGPRNLRVEMSGAFVNQHELALVLREIADGLEGKPVDTTAIQAANCPFAFMAEQIGEMPELGDFSPE